MSIWPQAGAIRSSLSAKRETARSRYIYYRIKINLNESNNRKYELLDEQIAEEKRTLEQLKKDQDTLVKKAKVVENSLKQAQHELENFQREKQKKINNLDIVVMLRLNQIEYLKDGRLPSDLSASLAFDSRDLERLQRRIKELQVEKAAEKKLFK